MPSAQRFLDELQAAYSAAAAFPHRYPSYLHGTRRVQLKKFPYFIVYLDWQDEVYIVAAAHAKRRPGFWANRI
jgi:plasmid stabilization system protein ParE